MTYKYFDLSEFKCPDCGANNMNPRLVHILDEVREQCGFPLVINSGFRCETHNLKVGGSPTSSHLRGVAADIRCIRSTRRYELLRTILDNDISRIGVAKEYIHVDIDQTKPNGLVWMY